MLAFLQAGGWSGDLCGSCPAYATLWWFCARKHGFSFLVQIQVKDKSPKIVRGKGKPRCCIRFVEACLSTVTIQRTWEPVMGMKSPNVKVLIDVLISYIYALFYLLYNCCINLLEYVASFKTTLLTGFFPSVCQLRTVLGDVSLNLIVFLDGGYCYSAFLTKAFHINL